MYYRCYPPGDTRRERHLVTLEEEICDRYFRPAGSEGEAAKA